MIVLCFLCLSPETSKNAEGIGVVSAYFCRELVLVKKYDNTAATPRNEGGVLGSGVLLYLSKKFYLTSDNIHSEYIII